ncbi:MAG: RNase adapter RapZ [Myxococcota bacterium]
MRIVIVTGLSGSGKTNALRALEDVGFYAVDNLPILLLDQLIDLFGGGGGREGTERLALVVDGRMTALPHSGGNDAPSEPFEQACHVLEATERAGHEVDILFLDSSDEMLERRYSETRRRHPLSIDGSVKSGVQAERKLLEPLRQRARTRIDTSRMSVHDLRRSIQTAFAPGGHNAPRIWVNIMSFGFKHGLPPEADLVFDVRFLPNPYFVLELRDRTGLDQAVRDYVRIQEEYEPFLKQLTSLLQFLLPQYEQEGKAYLTIAIGCTGGRHRSVTVAHDLCPFVSDLGMRVEVRHRDLDR